MKVEISNIGRISSSIIEKELTEEQFKFLKEIFEELNNEGDVYSPTVRIDELVDDGEERIYLKWVDAETKEHKCYNCCLWSRDSNKCTQPDLCKRPRESYKGYFIVKRIR